MSSCGKRSIKTFSTMNLSDLISHSRLTRSWDDSKDNWMKNSTNVGAASHPRSPLISFITKLQGNRALPCGNVNAIR